MCAKQPQFTHLLVVVCMQERRECARMQAEYGKVKQEVQQLQVCGVSECEDTAAAFCIHAF